MAQYGKAVEAGYARAVTCQHQDEEAHPWQARSLLEKGQSVLYRD